MKAAMIAIFLCLIFVQCSFAERMNSTNNSAIITVNDIGGPLNGTANKLVLTSEWVTGVSNSSSKRVCLGYMCLGYGPPNALLSVSFLMDFSINETGNVFYVDANTTPGIYRRHDLTKFFACVENPSIYGTPVFGIVYAGNGFNYIRLDQGTTISLRLSEARSGNRFIIPATGSGCSAIRSKVPVVFPFTAFALPANLANLLEMIISYPFDLSGDYEKTGNIQLVLEKDGNSIKGEIR